MKYFTFIFSFFVLNCYAQGVDLSIRPQDPIQGESFKLIFEIQTIKDDNPRIAFDPSGLEVLGRVHEGTQINTTYINGKLDTKKTIIFSYELLANKSGRYLIKDIKIEIGDETLTAKNYPINVQSRRERKPDIFVEAEITKDKVYIGEGIDVNYYIYAKHTRLDHEILEFPKLNNFLKRVSSNMRFPINSANVAGEVYYKKMIYKTRVYPEKLGIVKIDPIKLRVEYITRNSLNPFMSAKRSKNISSKSKRIEVLPLPTNGLPSGFSGLVGSHEFEISKIRSKYLVNEAIEFKLTVKGLGALEKMDAPQIFDHENLEEFEVSSEMVLNEDGPSSKIFQYTYLARGPLDLAAKKLPISFFDTDKEEYVTIQLEMPQLLVVGGSVAKKPSAGPSSGDFVAAKGDSKNFKEGSLLAAPYFSQISSLRNITTILNLILVLWIGIMIGLIIKKYLDKKRQMIGMEFVSKIDSKDIRYSDFYKLIFGLTKDKQTSARLIIEKSSFSPETKKYLKEVVSNIEKNNFSEKKKEKSLSLKNKHFKILTNAYLANKRRSEIENNI